MQLLTLLLFPKIINKTVNDNIRVKIKLPFLTSVLEHYILAYCSGLVKKLHVISSICLDNNPVKCSWNAIANEHREMTIRSEIQKNLEMK